MKWIIKKSKFILPGIMLLTLTGMLVSLMGVVFALLSKHVLDIATTPGHANSDLIRAGAMLFVFLLVQLLLEIFQIGAFPPGSICSMHPALSCQFCFRVTLLPTHHPSSIYFFSSQQLKWQHPHLALLGGALGSLPIQTLSCSRICWTPSSAMKHPLIFQSEMNLCTL